MYCSVRRDGYEWTEICALDGATVDGYKIGQYNSRMKTKVAYIAMYESGLVMVLSPHVTDDSKNFQYKYALGRLP